VPHALTAGCTSTPCLDFAIVAASRLIATPTSRRTACVQSPLPVRSRAGALDIGAHSEEAPTPRLSTSIAAVLSPRHARTRPSGAARNDNRRTLISHPAPDRQLGQPLACSRRRTTVPPGVRFRTVAPAYVNGSLEPPAVIHRVRCVSLRRRSSHRPFRRKARPSVPFRQIRDGTPLATSSVRSIVTVQGRVK
jgi:hypothetical protein